MARAQRPDAAPPQRDPRSSRRGGAYSPSAGEGTAGMLGLFRDAGLTPAGGGRAAPHPLRLRGRLRVRDPVGPDRGRAEPAARGGRRRSPAADSRRRTARPARRPPTTSPTTSRPSARWDPAQFAAALDIVLGATGTAPAAHPAGHTALGRVRPQVRRRASALLPDGDQRDAELVLELLEPVDLGGVDRRRVHLMTGEREDRDARAPSRATRSPRSAPGRAWWRDCTAWHGSFARGWPCLMPSPRRSSGKRCTIREVRRRPPRRGGLRDSSFRLLGA